MSEVSTSEACEVVEAWLVDVLGSIGRGDLVEVPPDVVMLLDRYSDADPDLAQRWTGALVAATDRVIARMIDSSLEGHEHVLGADELARALAVSTEDPVGENPVGVPQPAVVGSHFSRHKWLLRSDPISRSTRSDDEIDAAWRVARRANHVVALAGPRLLSWAERVSDAMRSEVEDTIIAARVYAGVQDSIASQIAATFDAAGIPYVFLKGAAVVTMYEAPYLRQGHDIDLGVAREHLRRAVTLLLELHFCPADSEWFGSRVVYRNANPLRRFLTERTHHYELGMLVKPLYLIGVPADVEDAIRRAVACGSTMGWFLDEGGRLGCHANVDVHYGITGRIAMESLLEGARTVDGRKIPSMDWLMFHSISKIYWEGIRYYGAGLHHYCDLLRMLPNASVDENIRLVQRIERDGLGPGAYYVLRRLKSEFGSTLPRVLEDLVERYSDPEEHADALSINDHGDMWPKQWVAR